MNEHWRRVFRVGLAPQFTLAGLEALRTGLLRDDNSLMEAITVCPPGLDIFTDAPVEAACAVAYAGWKGDGLGTVGEVQAYFDRLCCTADTLCDETGSSRWFLGWFDETPRSQMRRQLLEEVAREIERRKPCCASPESSASTVSAAPATSADCAAFVTATSMFGVGLPCGDSGTGSSKT